jgi:hypothetical protein
MSLTNPLEQREFLPDLLNWRGLWTNNIQYYKNDIAIDGNNLGTYICISNTSRSQQPISSSDWFEFFPHRTAVDGIGAGAGIGLLPPTLSPTIVNTGIRSITSSNGIGSATIGQVTEVFNLGLLGCINGVGISGELSNGTLTLSNVGVVGSALIGFGNVGTPQNIQLSNLGIRQITAGTGIAVSVDASNNYTLSNVGVESLGLGRGLNNIGTTQDPVLTATPDAPYLDILAVAGPCAPNPIPGLYPTTPGARGLIPVVLPPNSQLEFQLRNGNANPKPYWLMDLTGIWMDFTTPAGPPIPYVQVGVQDSVTPGGPYTFFGTGTPNYASGFNGHFTFDNTFAGWEGRTNLGWLFMNPNDIRSAGLKTITDIIIVNPVSGAMTINGIPDVVQMRYYPNVLP